MKRGDRRFLMLGGTMGVGVRSDGGPSLRDSSRRRSGRGLLLATVTLSILAISVIRFAAANQEWVETAYASRIAPAISLLLTRLSGPFPFSVAEVIVIALPLIVAYRFARVFVWSLARLSRRTFAHKSEGRPSLITEMALLAALTTFGAATFYSAWGLNYARPSLEVRLGWSELAAESGADSTTEPGVESLAATGASLNPNGASSNVTGSTGSVTAPSTSATSTSATSAAATSAAATSASAKELEALAGQLVRAANATYERMHGSVDLGRPSDLTVQAIAQPISAAALFGQSRRARHSLDEDIDEGFAIAGEELALSPSFKVPRGPAKAVAASNLLSRLGLAGFYFPWTGEANYNRDMPPFQLPQTIAHEKAHQRGIGGEDEANFLGYVAGLRSPADFARYSAQLFGQRQLLRELISIDPDAAERLINSRHAGVQRDVDAANSFWRRFDGKPADLQRKANDSYLRFNGIESGIDAYQESTRLIVLYARASGGRAMGYLGDRDAGFGVLSAAQNGDGVSAAEDSYGLSGAHDGFGSPGRDLERGTFGTGAEASYAARTQARGSRTAPTPIEN